MLSVDLDSRQTWIRGTLVHLTWTEFEILTLLASRPMKCFSKNEITRYLWGRDYFYDAHTIESHVSRLRKKLDSSDRTTPWITTVRKAGYRLDARAGIDLLVTAPSTVAPAGIGSLAGM